MFDRRHRRPGPATRRGGGRLPVLQVAPTDPAAGLLATLTATDPARDRACSATPRCTASRSAAAGPGAHRAGDPRRRRAELDERRGRRSRRLAGRTGTAGSSRWHRAAERRPHRVRPRLRLLPGEQAPKLALAVAPSARGRPRGAASSTTSVAHRPRLHDAPRSAWPGVGCGRGDRAGAVDGLNRCPSARATTSPPSSRRARTLLAATPQRRGGRGELTRPAPGRASGAGRASSGPG